MNGKVLLCLCLVVVALVVVNAMPQRGNPNYRHVEPIYSQGLDTSDGKYAKFNGPVKGLPHGHGGGRWGAADCLLCG